MSNCVTRPLPFPPEEYLCTDPKTVEQWEERNQFLTTARHFAVLCHDCTDEFNSRMYIAGRCRWPSVRDAMQAHPREAA